MIIIVLKNLFFSSLRCMVICIFVGKFCRANNCWNSGANWEFPNHNSDIFLFVYCHDYHWYSWSNFQMSQIRYVWSSYSIWISSPIKVQEILQHVPHSLSLCVRRQGRQNRVGRVLSHATSFLTLFSACPPSFKLLPRPQYLDSTNYISDFGEPEQLCICTLHIIHMYNSSDDYLHTYVVDTTRSRKSFIPSLLHSSTLCIIIFGQ